MHPLPSLVALSGALLLTPWLARRGERLGLVDTPGARKMHAAPTPRTGGVSVVLALLLGWLTWLGTGSGPPAGALAPYVLPLLGFFVLGLLDDRRGIAPGTKLLLQLALCTLAVALGLEWGGDAIGPFPALTFGAATPAMSVLWLVAVLTVINWIDGIDLITATTCVVLLATGAGGGAGPGAGALYAVAAGALLGFAFWNISPARVFLGDSGTHALGFLVGTLALEPAGTSAAALPWALASAPLLPGVVDIAVGLRVKARRGVPLWAAHRQHLHQRLTRVGWSHPAVALRYGVLALVAVGLVAWVGPRHGIWVCAGAGALVLGGHLVHLLARTHGLPYEFAPDEATPP